MEMEETIFELIRRYGPPRLQPIITANIKESLVLKTTPVAGDQLLLGQSRLGGRPDLPPLLEWPTWKDKSLSFLAQINLAELPSYDFLKALPPAGTLAFFYSAEQETWGFDPKDRLSWRVIYFDSKELSRREFPQDLPDYGKYGDCSLNFVRSLTIPAHDAPCINLRYDRSDRTEIAQYGELDEQIEQFLEEGGCLNRLLGHPDQIQHDMQSECQWASHGLYCGNGRVDKSLKGRLLQAGAKNWEMLLQIDSNDPASMTWGDVGKLYFWITRKDLKARNFKNAWMVLQCY